MDLCPVERCWNTTKAMPLSEGMLSKKLSSALSPPADVPRPTTAKFFDFVREREGEAFMLFFFAGAFLTAAFFFIPAAGFFLAACFFWGGADLEAFF